MSNDLELIEAIRDLTAELRRVANIALKSREQLEAQPNLPSPQQNYRSQAQAMVVDFKCPRCGSPMTARYAASKDEWFAGCTKYPTCKGTRNLAGTTSTT